MDQDAFVLQCERFRRELLVHCYRMSGSLDDAEDLVQETMTRAWRAQERYDEGRASIRTWLYAIASNVCLTDLAGRGRRPLPAGIGQPSDDPDAPLVPAADIGWIQPLPDLRDGVVDPAGISERRGSLRLAFVAAVQLLPLRQRAVLILRDVLAFTAAEVAEVLETTPAAVNSALQRAKSSLRQANLREGDMPYRAGDPKANAMIARYVTAFEAADVDALVHLLADDVILEMPPVPLWFRGPVDYGRFIARVFVMRGTDWRMLVTSANTQPALAAYYRDAVGPYLPHSVQVFDVGAGGIERTTVFVDSSVFRSFDLPLHIEA